jgi:hypothetical protein
VAAPRSPALPEVGQLRTSCTAGATTISFLNASRAVAEINAWGVNGDLPVAVSQRTAGRANGASTVGISSAATSRRRR